MQKKLKFEIYFFPLPPNPYICKMVVVSSTWVLGVLWVCLFSAGCCIPMSQGEVISQHERHWTHEKSKNFHLSSLHLLVLFSLGPALKCLSPNDCPSFVVLLTLRQALLSAHLGYFSLSTWLFSHTYDERARLVVTDAYIHLLHNLAAKNRNSSGWGRRVIRSMTEELQGTHRMRVENGLWGRHQEQWWATCLGVGGGGAIFKGQVSKHCCPYTSSHWNAMKTLIWPALHFLAGNPDSWQTWQEPVIWGVTVSWRITVRQEE